MTITLRSAELFDVRLTFRQPIHTAISVLSERCTTILRLTDQEGRVGYGEGVAFETPWYTPETQNSLRALSPLLYQLLIAAPLEGPSAVAERFRPIQGNQMAKAMFDGAVYELFAQAEQQSLATYLGGDDSQAIRCGKALGRSSVRQTIENVGLALTDGFERIKLKLAPTDTNILEQVRQTFPDAPLMFDANGSFDLSDLPLLQVWDEFSLLMMEQPFSANEWLNHQHAASILKTPLCLDESIQTTHDAALMHQLQAGQIINIKPARLGGLTAALDVRASSTYWLGGMFESGIGRRQTLAFATLPGLAYPIDMSGTNHYFIEDVLEQDYLVENGRIRYQEHPVSLERLHHLTKSRTYL
ncbi:MULTISPECIES: o-succinylbenzoate synthase [Exiguobacterium]|uniref:o-succinylbenzoate synthase n=1 Tax=Exiguobacterium TaxID=33986 RepID=UPI000478BC03|nr:MULTISPECIES: o-succinylbenzoate synthase [Exiguobacterium]MCT4780638.1 o-succinylbenzoate synthase [Exiguobacterium soli]